MPVLAASEHALVATQLSLLLHLVSHDRNGKFFVEEFTLRKSLRQSSLSLESAKRIVPVGGIRAYAARGCYLAPEKNHGAEVGLAGF